MRFQKGNKAAANSSKKAIAEIIRKRLERDGDSMSTAQFTALTSQLKALTRKRRRRPVKEPEVKKVSHCFADMLMGEEAEIHKAVLQIEAEKLEARRKERNGYLA